MTRSIRTRFRPPALVGAALTLATLLGLTGCESNSPSDPGPAYSAKGLAREFSFRIRAIAKGIPGASTGGAARKAGGPGDGQTVEQATEEVLFQDMLGKLRTIKGKPIADSVEEFIEEFSQDQELTNEQKERAAERLRTLGKESS